MRKDITTEKLMLGGEKVNKSEQARRYNCCWETIDRRLNPEKYKKERKPRVYTSNAIESINSALRKVTNGKGSFSSETSVLKLLYLRVEELKEKWNKPIPNWSKICSQLAIMHGERFTKYLNI